MPSLAITRPSAIAHRHIAKFEHPHLAVGVQNRGAKTAASADPGKPHLLQFLQLGIAGIVRIDKLAPVVADHLVRRVAEDRMNRRADVRDDALRVGRIEQVFVAQAFDQSAIALATFAQFAEFAPRRVAPA